MPDENMRHYLLDPLEAELLACYRLLSDDVKTAVIALITSQTNYECHKLDAHVGMSLIEK